MRLNQTNSLHADKNFRVAMVEGRLGTYNLQDLIVLLKALKEQNFTGYVRLTYASGQIRSIETFEEVLK